MCAANIREYNDEASASMLQILREKFRLNTPEFNKLLKNIHQATVVFGLVIDEMRERANDTRSRFAICLQALYNNIFDLRLTKRQILNGAGFVGATV